ncbi:MAG: hypothetical protein ACKVZJ_13760 [Phycisphaerales bacterium]
MRELLNRKPWLGYVLVGLLVAAGVYAYLFLAGSEQRSLKKLGEMVTIRDTETGDEWTMVRGRMELELIQRSATETLSARVGLTNPKTGKPNGFPVDGSWDEAIKRVNEQRAEANASRPPAQDPAADPKGK